MKKCCKLMAMLMALFVLVAAMPVSATAPAELSKLTMTVDEFGEGDETVHVTVMIETTDILLNGMFVLEYDADLMDVVIPTNKAGRPTPNSMTKLPSAEVNANVAGTVKVGFIKTVEEDTLVLDCTFTLKEAAKAGTTYAFEVYSEQLVSDNGTTNGYDMVADGAEFAANKAITVEHKLKDGWLFDGETHWHGCNGCDMKVDETGHTYSAQCDETCDDCGYVRVVEHEVEAGYLFDETDHWRVCSLCGTKLVHKHRWTVSVSDVNEKDTAVDVFVVLTTEELLLNGAFELTYDADLMDVVIPLDKRGNPNAGALTELPSSQVNANESGVIRVGFMSDVEEEAVVFKVTFALKEAAKAGDVFAFDAYAIQLVKDNGTENGFDYVTNNAYFVVSESVTVEHDFIDGWVTDEHEHWHGCNGCDLKNDKDEHAFDHPCDTDCADCGYVREITHPYPETYEQDENAHWRECPLCHHEDRHEHNWNEGVLENRKLTRVCVDCGRSKTETFADLDGDDTISSTDARMALQTFVGSLEEGVVDVGLADVDGDGKITSTDARLMLQVFVGSLELFPVEM